jgi:cytochrome P450
MSRPIFEPSRRRQRSSTSPPGGIARSQGSKTFILSSARSNRNKKKAEGEDLDFNELERLPLLDAVVRETLRMCCPVTFIWRQ